LRAGREGGIERLMMDLLDLGWNRRWNHRPSTGARRIRQTRQVVAYRLIARDTVEEKILELLLS
jgi:hypothetical protein